VIAVHATTIEGRIGGYRVERILRSTSTGTLAEAVHLVLPRRAVIKVAGLPPFGLHVLREACVLEAIRHPGVPMIYESGVLADRRAWFAAERIEGATLSERIVTAAMPAAEVVAIVRDIAAILEAAHRRGAVHGSLRPDRIVLARDRIAIVDWSDARAHDAPQRLRYVPVHAARPYLAPELSRGDAIDDRADVFALGVIAFQMLTGELPREREPYLPMFERAPHAPVELANMVDQMLLPDRFDRPATAEIRADLDYLVDVLAQETPMRIRKPKWTPPYNVIVTSSPATVTAKSSSGRNAGPSITLPSAMSNAEP
jgi:serine/threonine protein kinase